ncbi:prolyl oligopeptidase family serine peptidase [Kitasatospora aureofaciens]|uniref:alpha/beta hydrolase family protein n=1 Tax=Kitasatospora aureofaciens TaxID=1894 RepID=UPI001C477E91|nr:prolyl oligopeptidase family serine peptidase [Kitasatospora aureofaciens]MBV6702141.1 prolyl oligopeptidase family serine peptidase [Kitasatospora aureofaciens]
MQTREVVRYGSAPSQFAEMWDPEGGRPVRGLAVTVHGGWWRDRHDLHLMDALAADLAGRGWCVANIEYRRTGHDGGGWPQTLTDVLGAVAAARTARPHLAGLPSVAVGHSAGGQLALLAAGAGAVGGAVALAPITDLARCAAEGLGEGATPLFVGAPYESDPAAYRDASPLHRLPLGRPHLVVHGDADVRVPIAHSRAYVEAAAAAGDPVAYAEHPGADHFQVIDPAHASWATAVAWLEDRAAG